MYKICFLFLYQQESIIILLIASSQLSMPSKLLLFFFGDKLKSATRAVVNLNLPSGRHNNLGWSILIYFLRKIDPHWCQCWGWCWWCGQWCQWFGRWCRRWCRCRFYIRRARYPIVYFSFFVPWAFDISFCNGVGSPTAITLESCRIDSTFDEQSCWRSTPSVASVAIRSI